MTRRILLRAALVLVTGLLGGCASFDQHWKDAAAGRKGATRWDGKWISEQHHEDGRLRCVLEPRGKNLEAYFHANWLIFSSNFETVFSPVAAPRHGKVLAYRGTQDLPKIFGGTYSYDATLAERQFNCRYSSNYDHGTFVVQRVLP
jgi:hypothetical protein